MKTINKRTREDFGRFMANGAYCTPPGRAVCAMKHARILAAWREAEAASLVRLRAEPEQDNYFDVFGKTDDPKELAAITATVGRMGCWCVMAEVNHGNEASGDDWQYADSIGMCVYDNPLDPFENCYVPDLMASALKQIPQPGNVDELCTALES